MLTIVFFALSDSYHSDKSTTVVETNNEDKTKDINDNIIVDKSIKTQPEEEERNIEEKDSDVDNEENVSNVHNLKRKNG